MTTLLLLLSLAFAQNPPALPDDAPPPPMGALVVDTRQASEVLINGQKLFELLVPGRVEVPFPAGKHALRVWTGGSSTDLDIRVPVDGSATVLIGRTGISTKSSASPATTETPETPVAPMATEFRAVGVDAVMIHLDGKRHRIEAEAPLTLTLTPGRHPMSVRSGNGTVIWATGALLVKGDQPIIVQITEGRVPEVSGGATFSMGG